MAIASSLVTMVRVLINDLGTTPTYDDEKISQAIVVAGYQVTIDYSFSTDYTFDIDDPTITPDPTAEETYDAVMIALVTLKAACILSVNNYSSQVNNGVMVRDGDTQVDTTAGFKGYKDIILLGPCASYQKLLSQATSSLAAGLGKAIVGPYSHPDAGRLLGLRYTGAIFDSVADMLQRGY